MEFRTINGEGRPDYALNYPADYLPRRLDRPYVVSSARYEVPLPGESILEPSTRFYAKDLEIANPGDPVDLLFRRKREFLVKSVGEVLGLIYGREKLKSENLRRIDYDSCKLGTSILQISAWEVGADSKLEKARLGLEGDVLGLEREKRAEEVACWRDTTRLKDSLREIVERLWELKGREELIFGSG
jgi:hypothetical protein